MSASHIGPYEIIDRLGEGGMGVVYRGRDTTTGETVAVKTARPESRHALSSLRVEIAALARLEHPSIVRILGHGAQDGVPWYAMELLSGQTWADFNRSLWPPAFSAGNSDLDSEALTLETTKRRSTDRPNPRSVDSGSDYSVRYAGERRGGRGQIAAGRLPEVLTMARRLCTALTVLHNAGFVHRDLKPSNVFVVAGRPVVTDLGIASRFRGAVGRERIEVSGKMVGTVHYMAPEQALGRLVDARADLYAFGMMLYESLTGRLPFAARTADGWLMAVLNETPPPLSTFVEGAPDELDRLVRTLLSRESRERLGHADDVSRALERLGADDDPISPGSSRPYLYRPEVAGREQQRLLLTEAIERSRGGEGAIILIGGESGVGKTVLASEAARVANVNQMKVVTGECLPVSLGEQTRVDFKSAALHPLRPLLQHAADVCRSGRDGAFNRIFGEGRGRLLAAYEPSLEELPEIGEQSVGDRPIDAGRSRLLNAFSTVLRRLVIEDGPLMVLLDDLQWADEVTIAIVDWLAAQGLVDTKILIVGTYRADDVQPGLGELLVRPNVRRVLLDRLDADSVGSMVSDMLALPTPPPGFVAFLAKQSEGNPFFVAEYLRLAVSEGLLRRERGRWTFDVEDDREASYERLSLPVSIKELVNRRLSGLDPTTRAVLEVAAVLGRESERALLATVAELDESRLDKALKQLSIRQVLQDDNSTCRFVHDKIREATVDAIDDDRKRALSRAAANTLEAAAARDGAKADHGRLAGFWSGAQAWPQAIEALEKAAEEATVEFAYEQAIRMYRNLLEVSSRNGVDVGPTRRGLWERGLADASFALGRDFEGRQHIERALNLFGQPRLPVRGLTQGWSVLRELVTRFLQGFMMPWFRLGPGLPRRRTAEAAYAYNRLLEHTLRNNETVLAVYAVLRNVNLAERIPPRPALARGYAMLSYVTCLTPFKELAARLAQQALDTAKGLGSDATTGYVVARVMAYQVTVAQWEAADDAYAEAVRLGHALGDKKAVEEANATRAVGLYAQGRFRKSLDLHLETLESASERGDHRWQGFGRCGAVESSVRLGLDADVRSQLPLLKRWAEGKREQSEALWAYGATSLAAWYTGDEETARLEADRALRLMRESPPQVFFLVGPLWGLCELYLALCERHADASNDESAVLRRQLGEAVKRFSRFSKLIRFARPYALIAEGGLAWRRGRAPRALMLWQQGLTLAEQLGTAHAEAGAHYELGRHLDGDKKRHHLDQAISLYESMNAKPELIKAKKALASNALPV